MRRRSSGSAAEEEGVDSESNADVIVSSDEIGSSSNSNEAQSNSDSSRNLQKTARLLGTQPSSHELDRRKSIEKRTSTARSRRPSNTNWKLSGARNGPLEKRRPADLDIISVPSKEAIEIDKMPDSRLDARRPRLRSPWSCSPLTLVTTLLGMLSLASILHSFVSRQLDTKGCRMSYMRPSFAKLSDFDTEHTRFASKYSVYLYREGMVDEDTKVRKHNRWSVNTDRSL